MTTLAEITYQIAKKTMDVMEGTATAGTSASLTDSSRLNQGGGYWDNGTLWILSGTHSGKVVIISSFSGNKVTFADLGSSVGTCNYAIARAVIPYTVLKQAVNSALDEIKVPGFDTSITTTGATEYSLPSGVSRVTEVETTDGTTPELNTHWEERAGKLIFDSAPSDTLRLTYLKTHPVLSLYSDTVDSGVNVEWLRWAAVVNCLRYGVRMHQKDPALRMDEFLNEAYRKVETLKPYNRVMLKLRTAN